MHGQAEHMRRHSGQRRGNLSPGPAPPPSEGEVIVPSGNLPHCRQGDHSTLRDDFRRSTRIIGECLYHLVVPQNIDLVVSYHDRNQSAVLVRSCSQRRITQADRASAINCMTVTVRAKQCHANGRAAASGSNRCMRDRHTSLHDSGRTFELSSLICENRNPPQSLTGNRGMSSSGGRLETPQFAELCAGPATFGFRAHDATRG